MRWGGGEGVTQKNNLDSEFCSTSFPPSSAPPDTSTECPTSLSERCSPSCSSPKATPRALVRSLSIFSWHCNHTDTSTLCPPTMMSLARLLHLYTFFFTLVFQRFIKAKEFFLGRKMTLLGSKRNMGSHSDWVLGLALSLTRQQAAVCPLTSLSFLLQ